MKFTGIVQKGKGRGRELGYPTANIPCADTAMSGVHAARVRLPHGEAPYMSAAFGDPLRGILEAHLLDFDDDIYGLEIEVELLHKLREYRQFEDDDTLKRAIAEDVQTVREYFESI